MKILLLLLPLLHTNVHDYFKIPVKPLFYHIFIVINTITVNKTGAVFSAPRV